uniref:RING-type domain-containing protein n=1 Tax=Rhabditophanes sp. KR3021 TaxID=114890 RepID=A0AC35TJZ8_9BILA
MDYPYLDEKPNGRKNEKGNRHAGHAQLHKYLKNDSCLTKDVTIVDKGAKLGKRARERLISEREGCGDYQSNVSYSINKDKRWDSVNPTNLSKAELDNKKSSGTTVVVVEQMNAALNGKKHSEDAHVMKVFTANGKGESKTKKSKSANGATYESSTKDNRKDSETSDLGLDEDDEEIKTFVKYQCTAGNPNTNHAISKLHKQKKNNRTVPYLYKEGSNMKTKQYYEMFALEEAGLFDEDPLTRFEQPNEYCTGGRANLVSQFNLADYIKEAEPVLVDYAFSELKSIDCITVKEKKKYDGISEYPSELKTNTLFEAVNYSIKNWENSALEDEVDQLMKCKLYNLRWLDVGQTRLTADFSKVLQDMPSSRKRMIMIVVVEKNADDASSLRLLFNAAFKYVPAFAEKIDEDILYFLDQQSQVKISNLTELLERIAEVGKLWMQNSLKCGFTLNHDQDSNQTNMNAFESYCNSEQLSQEIVGMTEYQMSEILRKKYCQNEEDAFENIDRRIINRESFSERSSTSDSAVECEEYSVSDFEMIEHEDIVEPVNNTNVTKFIKLCDMCEGTFSLQEALFFNDCEHNFCHGCLSKEVSRQIRCGKCPVKCPGNWPHCDTVIPVTFLPVILPLPLITYYINLQYTQLMLEENKIVTKCIRCDESASLDSINQYNQVNCKKCYLHFCIRCQSAPHWPMTCEQNVEWRLVYKRQCDKHEGMEVDSGNGFKENALSEKFFLPSKDAHDLRFDILKANKIDNLFRKVRSQLPDINYSQLRKTVLHLVEYGYGYCYNTRAKKPENWGRIKNKLDVVFNSIGAIDSSLRTGKKENTLPDYLRTLKANVDTILKDLRQ